MVSNIGISRFMLGAHSFDQVLYGWCYGLWFAFFLFKYVRPPTQRHIRKLLETGQLSTGVKSNEVRQRDEFAIHQ